MENKLKELVYTAVGEASMCWFETPKGQFDEKLANDVSQRLVENIKKLYATK